MNAIAEKFANWRRWCSTAAAMLAAALTVVAIGKTAPPVEDEPRMLTLDRDAATRLAAVRPDLARTSSLWPEGLLFECRVTAFYRNMDSAHFLPVAHVDLTADGEALLSLAPAPHADVTVAHTSAFALAA